MNLPTVRKFLVRELPSLIASSTCIWFTFASPGVGLEKASAQSAGKPTLAETLARAPQVSGTAPDKYPTPFLITRVVPKGAGADTCYVEAVTNGMSYELFADGLASCHHLPDLHGIEWGRRVEHLAKQSIDLVYTGPGKRVKAATYFVKRSTEIPADWTEDQ